MISDSINNIGFIINQPHHLAAKAAATTLGFNEKMWDENKKPHLCDKYHEDLTDEQQDAAAILGFSEVTWDNE